MVKTKNDIKIATIDKFKIILFCVYILLFYIYGANSNAIIYSEIILVIFLGLEILTIIKEGKILLPKTIICLLLFAIFCFISCLWALNPDKALIRVKTLFLLIAFILMSYNFFTRLTDGIQVLMKIIMYCGLLYSFYVIGYYGIQEFFSMLIAGNVRIGTELNNVNTMALQASITTLLSVFYGLNKNKWYFCLGIIPASIALGTGSRKAIILIILSIILLYILKRNVRSNIKNAIKKACIFSLIIIGIIALIKQPIFSNVTGRMEGVINAIKGNGEIDASTKERSLYIKYGIEQFKESPILGIGIDNSSDITLQASGRETYLHNNYIELLATVGIIGFALYYYLYIIILYKGILKIKEKNIYGSLVVTIFISLLVMEFAMVTYFDKSTYIYILLGTLIINDDNNIKMQKGKSIEGEKNE